MLVIMPNTDSTQPAWTVTVENVGTVVASCEDEAYDLYDHYRKACIAGIAAGEAGRTVTLRQGERVVLQF